MFSIYFIGFLPALLYAEIYLPYKSDVIPYLIQKPDNELIKKQLEEYTMERKKTHYSTLQYHRLMRPNNMMGEEEKRFWRMQLERLKGQDEYLPYNSQIMPYPTQKADSKLVMKQMDRYTMKRKKSHIPTVKYQEPLYPNMKRKLETVLLPKQIQLPQYIDLSNADLQDIIIKQNKLLRDINSTLEEEDALPTNKPKTDYEKMLESMEKNSKIKYPMEVYTPKISNNFKGFTTFVDETAVRMALKNDPLVKRVLKMARDKREEYINSAKTWKP
ncbi:unnamed protein product [Leptidea sinapis]|uniref:Uncharacterized protein n=1 Tax=Leptidea sinapis TaxID=189913 RepID=A0A5E4Q223_9NEOP|nr:unnamed protein product [Leptidea sinapis]